MTVDDFKQAGVKFCHTGGRVQVKGPKGNDELVRALRAEVTRRIPAMRSPSGAQPRGSGQCDGCGDPMGNGRGGWCSLCCIARCKALEAA